MSAQCGFRPARLPSLRPSASLKTSCAHGGAHRHFLPHQPAKPADRQMFPSLAAAHSPRNRQNLPPMLAVGQPQTGKIYRPAKCAAPSSCQDDDPRERTAATAHQACQTWGEKDGNPTNRRRSPAIYARPAAKPTHFTEFLESPQPPCYAVDAPRQFDLNRRPDHLKPPIYI